MLRQYFPDLSPACGGAFWHRLFPQEVYFEGNKSGKLGCRTAGQRFFAPRLNRVLGGRKFASFGAGNRPFLVAGATPCLLIR